MKSHDSTLSLGSPPAAAAILAGGGEMGARMRAFDWSTTPLGPIERWPQPLTTCVRIMLTSRQPIWLGWGDQLTCLYNDAFLSIIGDTHARALGQPAALVLREMWAAIAPGIQLALAGHEGANDQALPCQPEHEGAGEETSYTFSYSPIPNDDGHIGGIFVHALEATGQEQARRQLETEVVERTRAQSLVARQRDVLELIARAAPLGETLEMLARLIEAQVEGMLCSILLLDRDGLHLRHGAAPSLPDAYNQAIDGIAIGPAVGSCGTAAYRGAAVVVPDIAIDPLWADFRDLALPHGLRACWSTPIMNPDGRVLGTFAVYHRGPHSPSTRELELVASLTYLAAIAIVRYRTETERAEMLEREQAARAEAETAVQVRNQVLTTVTHDLKNPLTAIKGLAQVLQRQLARAESSVSPLITTGLTQIDATASKMTEMMDELLDTARLQSGEPLALRPESVDLVALVRTVTAAHTATTDRHQFHVRPAELTLVGAWDRVRLERVFDNLLSNAIKYSPAGGAITIAARRERRAGQGWAAISVTDQGLGIPAEDLPRVFSRWWRGRNVEGIAGTGVGLAGTKQIVEQHGGTITVESIEGRGSTFTVWLPLA